MFMKVTTAKEQVTVKTKWGNSCITMSRNCSACEEDGIGITTKAGGWIWGCASRHGVKKGECIRRHKMYTRVSRETCLRETGNAHIMIGWAETDKGQPGKPNVRARWVAKEYKTHASTPPLELKVVLSVIATGNNVEEGCGIG